MTKVANFEDRLKMIDNDDIDARLKRAQEARKHREAIDATYLTRKDLLKLPADHSKITEDQRFNVFSLSSWMAIVERANIATVPAIYLGEVNVEDAYTYLIDGREVSDYSKTKIEDLNIALEETHRDLLEMNSGLPEHLKIARTLRWDHASTSLLKYLMSEKFDEKPATDHLYGVEYHEGKPLIPVDMRFMNTIMNYVSPEVPLLSRAWVKAKTIEGKGGRKYPVEWRVFVENGEVIGISNYYPQAPMTLDQAVEFNANEAIQMAHQLIEECKRSRLTPSSAALTSHNDNICCSLDFLVGEEGTVYFLEGGPAFSSGVTHPCCFLNEKGNEIRPINGLAISSSADIISTEDFEKKVQNS